MSMHASSDNSGHLYSFPVLFCERCQKKTKHRVVASHNVGSESWSAITSCTDCTQSDAPIESSSGPSAIQDAISAFQARTQEREKREFERTVRAQELLSGDSLHDSEESNPLKVAHGAIGEELDNLMSSVLNSRETILTLKYILEMSKKHTDQAGPCATTQPTLARTPQSVERDHLLMVMMGRCLDLAKPTYGTSQSFAKQYLRRHGIYRDWPENNALFVELLTKYANAERGLSHIPHERTAPYHRDQSTVKSAADLAALIHAGMMYGDDPYTVHTNAVADLVQTHFDEDVMISAAHLHDAIEDAVDSGSAERIGQAIILRCGAEVYNLVMALTDEPGKNRAERKTKTYPKIAQAGWRAVAIKVADRIINSSHHFPGKNYIQMYASEYPEFRCALRSVGLGVKPLQRMWSQLDRMMLSAGAKVDPNDCILDL